MVLHGFTMLRIKGNSKKVMVVAVLAVLTLAAFSTLLAPRARAADLSEARVLSYSWYVAPASTSEAEYTGDLITVGEVQNVGSNIIESVAVRGEAYNSTGDLVAWSLASFQLSGILPGQKAPFYMDFTPESSVTGDQSWVPDVTNVSITINTVRDTNSTPYSGLITAASSVGSSNPFTVIGIIQNNGSEATGSIATVTTFYDASGTVVALNFTNYLTDSLAPGATIQFSATPTDNTAQLSAKIATYAVLVQSVPLNASPSPSPSASSLPSASTSPTSSPTVTPSSSVQPSGSSEPQPTDSTWLIYIAVGVVAVVVVAVAVLVILKRRK